MRIRCLSVHAPYVCAHAGACCRAGWTIPVEDRLLEPLLAVGIRIGRDRIAPARPDGQCVFFEAEHGRLCAIHRRGGPSLLPSMCRHFPRVVVNDARGASVTLSHFCPTAAGLLFRGVGLSIVDAPASLALDGRLEGLDATSVLPPLLSPGVLTDWDGYSAWEDCAVALFDTEGVEPERAVAMLREATETACSWRPGAEPLAAAVRRSFANVTAATPGASGPWGAFVRPVNAFLAAHAFASWAAYDRCGLRSAAAAVADALEVLTGEAAERMPLTGSALIAAMGAADLRLRHAVAAAGP